ncbi:MAG: hypothetical protein P4L31_00865 [Candidatus Babeliales bacterium]|nr:hypothetical protein [Candidatus Babeliales bacterium]
MRGSTLHESLDEESLAPSCTAKIVTHFPVIIIAAKDDQVPSVFLKNIKDDKGIFRLNYDDLGALWDFSFYKGTLKIFTHDVVIAPKAIYHRHPGIRQDNTYYHKHNAFLEVLDQWNGNFIGERRDNHHNASKMYQMITSIAKSNEGLDNKVKVPSSFFVKGSFDLLKSHSKKPLIVKSCSSRRSKVAIQEEFEKWNVENTKNVPTLFQEQLSGVDIRVHVSGNHIWPLRIDGKDKIDYRYSDNKVTYTLIRLQKTLKDFCNNVSRVEGNRLVGIDLMKTEDGYFCLESNPGPAWAMFNHPSKKKFAEIILNELKTEGKVL